MHIIGTTGHSAKEEAAIAKAAARATIVKSGNMTWASICSPPWSSAWRETLGDDYDIEILEMHHNKKIDAPSGTALMLGRAAADGRGIDLGQRSARGRDGIPARAAPATSVLPRCAAAPWWASTR